VCEYASNFIVASWNDRPDTARELLLRGARLDATDALGRTPLHLASQRGRLKVAYILLDAGADLSCPLDHDGHSPLDVAKDSATAAAIGQRATEAMPRLVSPMVLLPTITPTTTLPAPIIPVTTMIPTTVSVPSVITPTAADADADADASLSSNISNNNNNNNNNNQNGTDAATAKANWNLVHTLMEQSKETKKAIALLTELVELKEQQGQRSTSMKDDSKSSITTMYSFSSSLCATPQEAEHIQALQTRLQRCQERVDGQQKEQLTRLRHRLVEMETQERQRVVQIAAMLGKIALYKSQQVEMTKTMATVFAFLPNNTTVTTRITTSSTNNNSKHQQQQQQQQQATKVAMQASCSTLHRQQSC
jgi:Ankyrin repeats (many copies)